jgi:hypothetical protein
MRPQRETPLGVNQAARLEQRRFGSGFNGVAALSVIPILCCGGFRFQSFGLIISRPAARASINP